MPKIKKQDSQPTLLVDSIVEGMQEKKAQDIVVMDLRKLRSAPADFFIICNGESDRQVEAIAKSVDEFVNKRTGEDPWHLEGMENAEWVLLDYVNVVAHIFVKEKREFYGIEELWGDAEFEMIA